LEATEDRAPGRIINPLSEGRLVAAPFTGLPKGSPSVHLDALRGFAAFSVLLNHWRDAFFTDYGSIAHPGFAGTLAYVATGLGRQWVIVFFVMSGYLVGGSVLRSVNSARWSWPDYLLARLSRLYIVLLPALLLGGTLDWAGMHLAGTQAIYSGRSGMHALITDVHAGLTIPALVGNSFFLQTIVLPGMRGRAVPVFGSNGPLWSLCNEFWYYLAFPLLVLLLAKGRTWRRRLLCGLGLLTWEWFVGHSIALLGIPWLMGALIVYLPSISLRRVWVRGLAVSSVLLLLAAGLVLSRWLDSLFGEILLGAVVALLIWVTLSCPTTPLPSVYVHIAHRSSRSSYTLYLVHFPMLIFLKAWFHEPRSLPGMHTLLVSAGILLGVLLYAQVVYEVFEKNTDRLRGWLKLHLMQGQRA